MGAVRDIRSLGSKNVYHLRAHDNEHENELMF
jgi:hypothetical protein